MLIKSLTKSIVHSAVEPIAFRSGELYFIVSVGFSYVDTLHDASNLWQEAWQAKENAVQNGGNQSLPGVSEKQRAMSTKMGCSHAQGFFFSTDSAG